MAIEKKREKTQTTCARVPQTVTECIITSHPRIITDPTFQEQTPSHEHYLQYMYMAFLCVTRSSLYLFVDRAQAIIVQLFCMEL